MTANNWFRIALINLLVLSSIGVLLRYKIAFELEWVDQKHVLHGHSHFAFAGWVSQALMVLMIALLNRHNNKDFFPKYKFLLVANLLTAYGMLIAFIMQGYGVGSIIFSTLSILVSYIFCSVMWRDISRSKLNFSSALLLKSSLIFQVISSLGAFFLAYMMVHKIVHQNWYLSSIYFYLHFQYNGWFTMACLGLFFYLLERIGIGGKTTTRVAWIFVVACIPTFLLSVLWLEIPDGLHAVVTFFALAQLAAWLWLMRFVYQNYASIEIHRTRVVRMLFICVAVAMTIKVFLQAGSTIHALSDWAFGFRPIVIGYLHLVLLGVISLFILAYALHTEVWSNSREVRQGVFVLVAGIILNECILMIQGVAALSNTVVSGANVLLLVIAVIMFSGLLRLNMR